jgi:hypothetical protein
VVAKSNPYTQLAIGICGHVVGTWPQITDIGGSNPLVVCEECTQREYALNGDETFIWVRLAPDKTVGVTAKLPKPKRASKPKVERPLTVLEKILREEGLF